MRGRPTNTLVRVRRQHVLIVLDDGVEEADVEYRPEDARRVAAALLRAVRLVEKEREAFRPGKRAPKVVVALKLVQGGKS